MVPVALDPIQFAVLVLSGELERHRKLKQNDSQPIPIREYVKKTPARVHIGRRVPEGLDGSRCLALSRFGSGCVGEHLVSLDRKLKAGLLHRVAPAFRDLGFKLPVERRVDLADVEVARQVGQFWNGAADLTFDRLG